LQVIEIDHPLTQEAKKERYRNVGFEFPLNNHLVAVDFEKDNVIDGLERSPYMKKRPAIISWLGVTFYLTPEDSLKTLKHLANYCAPGTEIVFDYLDIGLKEEKPPFKSAARMKRFVSRRGEPFQGWFDPTKLEKKMKSVGLELVANYVGREQAWMYPPPEVGVFGPCEYIHIAHVRVPPRVQGRTKPHAKARPKPHAKARPKPRAPLDTPLRGTRDRKARGKKKTKPKRG